MDKLKFTLKEVITICVILIGLTGSWYSLTGDIRELKKDNEYIKTEFTDFKTSVRNNLDLVNKRVFVYGAELKKEGIDIPRDKNWEESP